jgi:hypothetical protein
MYPAPRGDIVNPSVSSGSLQSMALIAPVERLYRGRQPAVHAEDAALDDGGQAQAVEDVGRQGAEKGISERAGRGFRIFNAVNFHKDSPRLRTRNCRARRERRRPIAVSAADGRHD